VGRADIYSLAHAQRMPSLLFPIGWLMLGGYIALGALLTLLIVSRLETVITLGVDITIDPSALLAIVLGLALLNEFISSSQKWWTRPLLTWGPLFIILTLLGWAFFIFPKDNSVLPSASIQLHDLASLSFCAILLWGMDLALDQRATLLQPQINTLPSLLLVVLLPIFTAGFGIFLILQFPYVVDSNWLAALSGHESRLIFLAKLTGIVICWTGLSRILTRMRRIFSDMRKDGFLPYPQLPGMGVNSDFYIVLLSVTLIAFAATFLTPIDLISGATFIILWVVIILAIPILFKGTPSTRTNRLTRPFIVLVIILLCAFLSVILPSITSHWLLIWIALGGIVFGFVGRKGLGKLYAEDSLIDSQPEDTATTAYRILVCLSSTKLQHNMLQTAVALARKKQGEIVLLRVMIDNEEIPEEDLKKNAQQELEHCKKAIAAKIPNDIKSRILVRIAPKPASGILAAATESQARIIMLGWSEARTEKDELLETAVMDRVFASASRPVLAFRGEMDKPIGKILVATAGGPHASTALRMASLSAAKPGSEIILLHILTGKWTEEDGQKILEQTLTAAQPEVPITTRLIRAEKIETAILREAKSCDVLVLGASVDEVLRQTVPRGLPARIARKTQAPTIVAKSAEKVRAVFLRRTWGFLSNPLPTLSVSERAEIYSSMRMAARANVDFYTLMSLAAAIATLGLMQNSAAVIIGAMLVAPLMSPILALAQGVVQGNIHMLRRSASSTAKGIFVAIAVATILTLMFAAGKPSAEILARTNPSIIDLIVALASGAAAAYAGSRKNLSAALPGVAIAAALVPPLCVVGYGIGISAFDIALGAMLLFLTNLSAIVLAGAITFLFLGFRPTRAARGGLVRRAIFYAVFAILILAIPLGLASKQQLMQAQLSEEITEAFRKEAAKRFNLRSLNITQTKRDILIDIVIYSSKEIDEEEINDFRVEIEKRVKKPVHVRASIVAAMLTEVGPAWTPPKEPDPEESEKQKEITPSRNKTQFRWPWEAESPSATNH